MARRDGLARFTEAAAGLGVEVVAVRYPEGTRTAVDAARAIGCGVDQIVKSLVVVGPDGPAVALTAGHHRLDLERLGVLIGGPARMAGAEEARAATGYSIGGTPPFGHVEVLTTFVDPSLLAHPVVYGAAGTPDACFAIEPERLVRSAGATPADFVVRSQDRATGRDESPGSPATGRSGGTC